MAERTIREAIAEETREGFQKVSGTVAGHTREVLGDALGSLMDDIKSMTSGIFGVVTGGFRSIFGGRVEEKQLDEEKEQTSILGKILGVFKRQEKRRLASFGEDEGGMSALSAMFMGSALGNIVGSFVPGALIIGGIITAAVSGIRGYFKSEEWNVSKLSGIAGNIFGGSGKGLINSFLNAGKWAIFGATIGLAGGFPGIIIGGVIGTAIGGIMGFFGGEYFAKKFDNIINKILLGGDRSLLGQLRTLGSGIGTGATIGMVGGLPGMLIGATIGAAIGGIISFFGKDKITGFTSGLKSKLSNGGNEMIDPSRGFGSDDEREAGTGNRRMNLLGRMTKTLTDWGNNFNDWVWENITKPLTVDLPEGIKTAGKKLSDGGDITMGNPMNWFSNKEVQAGTGDIAVKRGGLLQNIVIGLKDWGMDESNKWNPINWVSEDIRERGLIRVISEKISKWGDTTLGNPKRWEEATQQGKNILSDIVNRIQEGWSDENNMWNPAHGEVVQTGKNLLKTITESISNWGKNESNMWNPAHGEITDTGKNLISDIVNRIQEGWSGSMGNPSNWFKTREIQAGTGDIAQSESILGKVVNGFSEGGKNSAGNPINGNAGKGLSKGVNIVKKIVGTLTDLGDRINPFVGKDSKTYRTQQEAREAQEKIKETGSPKFSHLQSLKSKHLKDGTEETKEILDNNKPLGKQTTGQTKRSPAVPTPQKRDYSHIEQEMAGLTKQLNAIVAKTDQGNKKREEQTSVIQQNVQNGPLLSPGNENMFPSDVVEAGDIRNLNVRYISNSHWRSR